MTILFIVVITPEVGIHLLDLVRQPLEPFVSLGTARPNLIILPVQPLD